MDKFEARVRALLEFKNRWGRLVLKQGERAVAVANAPGKTPQKETARQGPEATVSFVINNHSLSGTHASVYNADTTTAKLLRQGTVPCGTVCGQAGMGRGICLAQKSECCC